MKEYFFGPTVKGSNFNKYWLIITKRMIRLTAYYEFDGAKPIKCKTIFNLTW